LTTTFPIVSLSILPHHHTPPHTTTTTIMSINIDHAPLTSDSDSMSHGPIIPSEVTLNLEQDFDPTSRIPRTQSTLQKLKAFLEQKEHEVHDIIYNSHVRRQFLFKYLHWKNIVTVIVSCMCLGLLIVALVVGLIFFKTRGTKLYPGSFVFVDSEQNNIKLFDAYFNKIEGTVESSVKDAKSIIGGTVVDGSIVLFWKDKWEVHPAEEKSPGWTGASGAFPDSSSAVGFGYDHDNQHWMALAQRPNSEYWFITEDGQAIQIPGITGEVGYARVARHKNQVLVLVSPKMADEDVTEFTQQLFEIELNTTNVFPVGGMDSLHFHTLDADIYAEVHEENEVFLGTAHSINDTLTEGGKLYTFSVQNHALKMIALSNFIEVGKVDGSKSFHSFYNYEEWNLDDKTKTKFMRVTTLLTKDGRLYTVNSRTAQVYADTDLDVEHVSAVGLNTNIKG